MADTKSQTYEEALASAIHQSQHKLVDCKLYIKYSTHFYIGFTPDSPKDAYIYNGEVKCENSKK